MNHEERVSHLADIVILLEFHEKLGGARNKWILAEFNYHNEELIKGLKEAYDETGKRKHNPQHQAGAGIPGREPGLRGPAGEPRRPGESRGDYVRRTGVESPYDE